MPVGLGYAGAKCFAAVGIAVAKDCCGAADAKRVIDYKKTLFL